VVISSRQSKRDGRATLTVDDIPGALSSRLMESEEDNGRIVATASVMRAYDHASCLLSLTLRR